MLPRIKLQIKIRSINKATSAADAIDAAAFSGQKKFTDSLASLQRIYDANPSALRPMAAIVDLYLRSQQQEKAVAFLQDALKANPDNAEALVLLGSVRLSKNDLKQAQTDFESAIKHQPKNPAGYRALASLYARQKKSDEALTVIQAGLKQQPQDFALRLTLAGIYKSKHEYERAITEYETLLKQQPGSMVVANNLASLLSDRSSDKSSFERAYSIAQVLKNSQVPQFKDTLGWIEYRKGNHTEALKLLEDAAKGLPRVALVHYHLGMSYLATGETAKASDQFAKARQLAPNDLSLIEKIDAATKGSAEKGKS